jgi:putative ATP-binding cassette transporter
MQMTFFQLVRREMHGSLPRLVFMSALGGISNAAILAAINAGAQAANYSHKSSLWAAALFVIALSVFIKTQYYIVITCAVETEAIIHRLRVRLMDCVRRSELFPMETIGRSRIVGAITTDTAVLKQASNTLTFGVQGLVLIFFVAIYVAYLSVIAFVLSVVIIGVAAAIFHIKSGQLTVGTREAAKWGDRLFDRLIDFLDGFKEVRLNSSRSDGLFADACEVSRTAANIKIWTDAETRKRLVSTQSFVYLLLGTVVFVAPSLSGSLAGTSIMQTTTALLFVVGACFGIVQSIPILMAADAAADRIYQLEADLLATAVSVDLSGAELPRRFDKIEMRNIVFRYVDKMSETIFQVGPVDFQLQAGDLVFITGGNGSGKSTFLKLLAGLYVPDSGEITRDGERVDNSTREAYRVLMTAIFTDYHLFQRLYGIPDPDPVEVDRLLTQFRLADKTGLTAGEFRTIDLSGGQRKRLALIVGLMEKRPILLLDEWTSDQDPEFRRKFYEGLLLAMKQAGTTVVVVTHDDRYLNELDIPARRLRMDEGRLVEQHSVEDS